MTDYDALLWLSFGGPEGPDDVIPFLQNVTRGRGIPVERLAEVGEHYQHFGGVSPINAQNRALIAAIETELAERGIDLPVYFGNRNWHPLLADTLQEIAADGHRRVLVAVSSAYASYSGCRQYRENLAAAVDEAQVGEQLTLDKVRHYFDHPGFVEPMIDSVVAAIEALPAVDADTRLVFTTHSIPVAAAAASGPPGWYDAEEGGAYVAQHRAVAQVIVDGVETRLGRPFAWDLVYQSRSGPPHIPWLEPDICDHLDVCAEQGVSGVVMIPVGFISDHMEVIWDLDTEAADHARAIGLPCTRAATVGVAPAFVAGLVDLVVERLADTPPRLRPALTRFGPSYDACPVGCCPNPRGEKPALCTAPGEVARPWA
ncbi:MAG: ferrochelatase [Actinobacteria bacterium]|nr:ferrochelatase [Actinomycetota bacterium]MCB9412740.1 ferrochelatase [Actinomycetota bacterium]